MQEIINLAIRDHNLKMRRGEGSLSDITPWLSFGVGQPTLDSCCQIAAEHVSASSSGQLHDARPAVMSMALITPQYSWKREVILYV